MTPRAILTYRTTMNVLKGALATAAIVLGACSGNFATGTGMPNSIPPMGGSSAPPYGQNGIPDNASSSPLPQTSGSPSAATDGVYAISEAQAGFACPSTSDGYACLLRFNVPAPTPTPATQTKGKKTAMASPVALTDAESDTDTHTDADGFVRRTARSGRRQRRRASEWFAVPVQLADAGRADHGAQSASLAQGCAGHVSHARKYAGRRADDGGAPFTLGRFRARGVGRRAIHPTERANRRARLCAAAFQITTHKKHTDYHPLWTFDKSTLKDGTLTFSFAPPKMTIPKGSTYALVLYGDDKSKVSPTPSASASESAGPSATPIASPAASESPTGQ